MTIGIIDAALIAAVDKSLKKLGCKKFMFPTTATKLTELNSEQVLALQKSLFLAGYHLTVDGILGPETKQIFAQFKKDAKLTRPSEMGQTTLDALVEAIAENLRTPTDTTKSPAKVDLQLIKKWEGMRLNAYLCPAGVWTIGYGCTYLANGRRVIKGDRLNSKAEAEQLLVQVFSRDFLPKLQAIPHWQEMSAGQQTALASFAWNLGAHFYGNGDFNSITRALKNKDWVGVPRALRLYNRAAGKVNQGLINRREDEVRSWNAR
ncbi:lysozyme [Picosynechococcus sp. PCC 8807]|uniref:lysozyme n=2 Tax=Picosynechococcus sp. PCC 8807 TaxID=195248 RepID=UPI0012ECCBD3|nr:lysozyme [Picosynechococcus sp. PCC 8807]